MKRNGRHRRNRWWVRAMKSYLIGGMLDLKTLWIMTSKII
jgi:hypothetical protein